jgi:hypothetical protein
MFCVKIFDKSKQLHKCYAKNIQKLSKKSKNSKPLRRLVSELKYSPNTDI